MNKKILIWSLTLFFLTSCAGLLTGYDARKSFEQGMALFNQGKYSDALPYFQRAVELEPEYTQAYIYLGRTHLSLRQWTQAIQPLRTAYRLSPGETGKEILNFLLDALIGGALQEFKQGNYSSSIGYLREALQMDPGSGKAKSELVSTLIAYGGSLLSEGNYTGAITQFTDAVRLAPGNFDAYSGLVKSFVKNGDYLSAIKTVNEAMKIAPSEQERSLLQDMLRP